MSLLNHIKHLEEKLLENLTRKSKINLQELLADEFIEFSSLGKSYNKKEIIEALLEENNSNYSLTDFKITLLTQEVILATYLAIKDKNIYSLRSSIWKSYGGKWKMVFHQGTLSHNT